MKMMMTLPAICSYGGNGFRVKGIYNYKDTSFESPLSGGAIATALMGRASVVIAHLRVVCPMLPETESCDYCTQT